MPDSMPIDDTPSQTGPSGEGQAGRPRATGQRRWLATGLRIGLAGGLAFALFESLLNKWDLLAEGTRWLWIESLGFSLLSHVVFGLIVCVLACWVGASMARIANRLGRWVLPGPMALAGLLTGEGLVFCMGVALVKGRHLPGGLAGLGWGLLVWLPTLLVIGLICRLPARTLVGRGMGMLARPMAWLAGVLVVAAVFVQALGRSRLQTPDRFWPPATARCDPDRADRRPNVVLIVCDALRVDRLGCYGYPRPTSPHIDAFAADAVVFLRAVSPGVWTIPAHASIFTGLYPSQHGARFGLDRLWLHEGFTTLAEALRDHGYQTMALSNNPIVSPATNLVQGFERFAEPVSLGMSFGANLMSLQAHILGKIETIASPTSRWFVHDAGGGVTTALAAGWLDRRDRSKPLFLFINFMETHDPYEPRLAYRRAFVRPEELARSYAIRQDSTTVWQYVLARQDVYSPADIRILSDLYDGRVRELDDRFADLIRVVAASVDLDNTVVVLTSDHGENLGERRLLGHQYCIYNTLVRVPLIVRWPKALSPGRVDDWVQTCDLFPTLLTWAGAPIKQSARLLARPLTLPSAPTTRDRPREIVSEYLFWPASPLETMQRMDPDFDPSPWHVAYRAIFSERWKLILGSGQRFQLYDLAADPNETLNLAASNRPTMIRLAQRAGRWVGSFDHFDPNRAPVPRDARVDDEQRKRLRNLGYVE